MARPKHQPDREPSIPAKVRPAYDAIVALTDGFCRNHLHDEYAALCRRLASVLARKRPSPITRGKPEAWASGIVRVLAWINVPGDSGNDPHWKLTAIDPAFGVSRTAGQAKSKVIRDLLTIRPLDPEWTLPGRVGEDPLAWMVQEGSEEEQRGEIGRTAAADTACLVGELHLRQGEYEKAVQAFTQAIESNPTADVYEGRARAYQALADRDERKARELNT
jgi:hypothetical protein